METQSLPLLSSRHTTPKLFWGVHKIIYVVFCVCVRIYVSSFCFTVFLNESFMNMELTPEQPLWRKNRRELNRKANEERKEAKQFYMWKGSLFAPQNWKWRAGNNASNDGVLYLNWMCVRIYFYVHLFFGGKNFVGSREFVLNGEVWMRFFLCWEMPQEIFFKALALGWKINCMHFRPAGDLFRKNGKSHTCMITPSKKMESTIKYKSQVKSVKKIIVHAENFMQHSFTLQSSTIFFPEILIFVETFFLVKKNWRDLACGWYDGENKEDASKIA